MPDTGEHNRASSAVVSERSATDTVRIGIAIALTAALVLFFAQNFDEAKISFLWFDWEMPLVVALLISALIGAAAALLFSTLRGRARRVQGSR